MDLTTSHPPIPEECKKCGKRTTTYPALVCEERSTMWGTIELQLCRACCRIAEFDEDFEAFVTCKAYENLLDEQLQDKDNAAEGHCLTLGLVLERTVPDYN